MKNQLVDDYLAHSDSRHGLYVVGWFDRDRWNDKDYRRNDVPFATRQEMHDFLEQQARSLTIDDREVIAVLLDCNPP